MLISINPGSGPVKDADESNACINIRAFADDLLKNGIASVIHRRTERDEKAHPSQKGGRYEFDLEIERAGARRTIAVSMPGIPLERVRYMDMPNQDIWQFPRLYIDGSSWVWYFALNVSTPEKDA